MLNKSFRYIGLDFETTGLDYTKDEPIQIGIVEIDENGKTIKEFSSLIRPINKTETDLKTIVGFITNIDINQLKSAPTIENILSEIEEFFGENTILIGHNIKFDIDFLQKYFPSCKFGGYIDTFGLAQMLLHYQQSYALEVLMPGEGAHNALYDTQNALKLFFSLVQKIFLLAEKYPILNRYILNENFVLAKYLNILDKNILGNFDNIPKLSKILPQNTQYKITEKSISTDKLENQKKYFVGNINIKIFLESMISNKKIIIAFSNLQKLDIAKNILSDMGIKNLGFLRDEQIWDYEKIKNFLQKSDFTNEEVCFIIKYYSHIHQGLGLIDLNCKSDYQIYYSLKNKKNTAKYPIVLTTHQGLFTHLIQEDKSDYEDYEILFMDAEWRYKNYNFFQSRPVDVYYTLNFIETLLYKNSLEETKLVDDLKLFYSSFQIFIGQLFIESKEFFVKTQLETVPSNPITTDSRFYKTNLLWTQIKESYQKLKDKLDEEDFMTLDKQFLHIDHIFNTVINIQKKMSNDDMYFVYSENTQYTSWSEFVEIFPSNIYFFSNVDKKAIQLFPDIKAISSIPITQIGLFDRILGYIQKKSNDAQKPTFFILSTRKEESKGLFDTFYNNKLHEEYLILVENITGGMGKNLFKAKSEKPKIIIGGYMFILSVYASKIPLDEIIVFNIRGGNEQSILEDIVRYANK